MKAVSVIILHNFSYFSIKKTWYPLEEHEQCTSNQHTSFYGEPDKIISELSNVKEYK